MATTTAFQSPALGAFFAAGDVLVEVLGRPSVSQAWDQPSALERMTVGDLAGHAARAVLTVRGYLDAAEAEEVIDTSAAVDPAGYVLGVMVTDDQDAPLHVGIRKRSHEAAAAGPAGLRDQVAATLTDLRNRVPPVAGTYVRVAGGQVIRLHDYLVTRVMELVVHLDDLAASLGEPIEAPAAAAEHAVKLLAEIARRRHGTSAVVAQLARAERIQRPVTAF